MNTQLKFMKSFIEDLLNITMIRDKVMTLANKKFKPHKVLEFIKDLFEVKAETKGVKIEYALTNDLYVPAISGKIDFREKFNENVSDND